MKKVMFKILVMVVILVGAGAAFVAAKKPAQRPASTEKVEVTPERVRQGAYLAKHVNLCMHCHTPFNPERWTLLGDEDKLGSGGSCWDEKMHFPGRVCSKNLTPDVDTGLGGWTDGEIMRAIREGVSKDGTPLFPIMPYEKYRTMSDEDLKSIVAYLRSIRPIKNVVPARELPFPLSIIVKFVPQPVDGPVPEPNRADPVALGKYLTTVGACIICHTPVDDKHQPIRGKEFAGGQEFRWGAGSVRSANLTPDATGLGGKTKEQFVALFRSFTAPEFAQAKVDPAKNTAMPWLSYAHMKVEELAAIYDYLRTVPPIVNQVAKYGDAPVIAPAPPVVPDAGATAPAATAPVP